MHVQWHKWWRLKIKKIIYDKKKEENNNLEWEKKIRRRKTKRN
jgi:hypothetical protein